MNRHRWFALALSLALSGCNCFTPVAELEPEDGGSTDGGLDSGIPDAGADGGALDAGSQCTLASDCAWLPPDGGFGYFPCPSSEGQSCIDGRCLFECNSGRACLTDAGTHCLDCTHPVERTECGPTVCSAIFSCRMQISSSTCTQGPVAGAVFDAHRQPDCSWKVTGPDGGPTVGAYWDLDVGRSFGTFPGVQGTCAGQDLFTGVPRMRWSCPGGCTFVEVGCD